MTDHTVERGAPHRAAGAAGDERVAAVLAVVREILGDPGITADDDLAHHGAASLAMARIIVTVGARLGLDVDPRDLGPAVTARALARAAG